MTRSEPAWPVAPRRENAARRAAERCAITAAARRAAAALAARDPGGGASSRTFGTAAAHTSHCKSPARRQRNSLSRVEDSERCVCITRTRLFGQTSARRTQCAPRPLRRGSRIPGGSLHRSVRQASEWLLKEAARSVSHLEFRATDAVQADTAAHPSRAVHAASRRRRR